MINNVNQKEKNKGIIAIVLLALVWASMGIFARYLSVKMPIFQQVYVRVLSAVLIGLIVFNKDLNFNKLKKISLKEWLIIITRTIAYYLFGVVLWSLSYTYAKYSNVSFISAIPTTAILGYLILKDRLTLNKFILILVSFLGVVIISVKDFSNLFIWGKGEMLALVSAFCMSFSTILRRKHSGLLNNKELSEVTFFFAFIFLFISSFLFGEGIPAFEFSIELLIMIILAGLINVLMLFLLNYGFEKIDTVLASNLLTLESVFAIIIGFLLYKELPSVVEFIGGALILLSVIQMNRLEKNTS